MTVDVVVIGGETLTTADIMQMEPWEFERLQDLDHCMHGCGLYPCGSLTRAMCQGTISAEEDHLISLEERGS